MARKKTDKVLGQRWLHVRPVGRRWVVRLYAEQYGPLRPVLTARPTRGEAVDAAADLQRVMSTGPNDLIEMIIFTSGGRISDRRSYPRSADPLGGG